MDPLNQQERRKAFVNFLIFFSITAALIIAAVLFSVEVPFKQNEQLRVQINAAEKERDFIARFFKYMDSTNNLLSSLDNKEVKVDFIDGKITERLKEMEAM
ncbi:MAG: hypothetical protein H7325_09305, partial [Pedobacter sp.]|nr:hypothetical protein [Pedobacter sp.]